MPYPDSADIAVEVFGGRNTSLVPAQQPPGASPDNEDVDFPEASVGTRDPLVSFFPPAAGNPPFNGLAEYTNPSLVNRLLALDGLGNLYRENPASNNPPSVLELINSGGTPGLYMNTANLFGRAYMAFGEGASGIDLPRQYDDTNFDRVSQCGPGAGPTIQDFLPMAATLGTAGGGSVVSIVSAQAVDPGNISIDTYGKPVIIPIDQSILITTAAPHGFTDNSTVVISNPLVTGSFQISLVLSPTTFKFLYQTSPRGQSGSGGTASEGPPPTLTWQRVNNTVTAFTTAPNGFQVGWRVAISGMTDAALANIASISRVGGIVTVETATPHGLVVDSNVDVSGVTGDTTFNGGPFPVQTVPSPTNFTYQQTLGDSNTATPATGAVASVIDGTFPILATPTPNSFQYTDIGPNATSMDAGAATIQGSVSAGLHQCAVAFVTRQGFITRPCPPITFNAGGGKLLSITNIPLGPSNVTQRLLIFTTNITPPATTGLFFSIPSSMLILDNTSTSVVIDFSDSDLAAAGAAGANFQYLFTERELGECNGVSTYDARTVWIGEQDFLQDFLNMDFCGGWDLGGGASGADVPLGWTSDPSNGANGSRLQNGGVWQDAYRITGAVGGSGQISQSAFQNFLGTALLNGATSYSVRLTCRTSLLGSFAKVILFSPSQGTLGTAFFTPTVINEYQTITQVLAVTPATIPSDAVLQYVAPLFFGPSITFDVDRIEPFLTNSPVNNSVARISYAFNPESIDGVTGQVQVTPGDGQTLRAAFKIRSNLYLAKDNYLAYVTDDGQNEPSFWTVNEVSNIIGIAGPNAWDAGEEWVAFAHRSGLYIFWGADPVKISQEIQTDSSGTGKIAWDSVNWDAGSTIWVRIDPAQKKILIGLPVNGATSPNIVMSIDYKFSADGVSLSDSPGATYSAFTGKLLERGGGRKWGLWNIQANSCTLSTRPDGTAKFFFGNGAGNGKIYAQVPIETAASVSDDGAAIASFYLMYGTPSSEEAQGLQLREHRKIYDYLTGRAVGNGTMNITVTTPYRQTAIRGITLGPEPQQDFERPLNVHGERAFFAVGTNAVGSWFRMDKFCALQKQDPVIGVRGLSQ